MPIQRQQEPWDVMVVDDEEGIRELILSYFSDLGMPATGAKDGRAAIAALERSGGRFGLVVTDLNMPGADGFAVLQAARAANSACYVVIITGYASLDSAIHAVRVGAYDYLTKPFSMGQLDLILRRITDRVSLQRQHTGSSRIARPGESAGAPAADALEQRVERMEAAIARIEAGLEALGRLPVGRR